MSNRWIVVGLIGVGLAALLWWGSRSDALKKEPAQAKVPAQATAAQPVPLPDLQLISLDGKRFKFSDFKDQVLLVDFWATWCPPCIAEVPEFIALQKAYAGQVQVIGLSLDESLTELKQFVAAKKLNYPVVVITDTIAAQFGTIDRIPTTLVVDRKGNIVKVLTGYHSKAQLESEIKPLLK
jgi:thiol-disulfide isomerase/thioredoxin